MSERVLRLSTYRKKDTVNSFLSLDDYDDDNMNDVLRYVRKINGTDHPKFEGKTHFHKLIVTFNDNIEALGQIASNPNLERWSILVHDSMSGNGRNFHSVQHVFDISAGADPIQTLSAMFHDCVYYNVDGGLNLIINHILRGIIVEQSDPVQLVETDPINDKLLAIVVSIFGFKSGQILPPFGGLNEFLSAMVAAREFEGTLTLQHIVRITACIEATIPFRKLDEKNRSAPQRLFERLQVTNKDFDIGFSEEELVDATQVAHELANRDVANFCTDDTAWFLDNTWKLLPETNLTMRGSTVYTISEYQSALTKINGFFGFLNPEVVYHNFRNVPSDAIVRGLYERVEANLFAARQYIRAKLVGITMLASLAELTGGDAPIALFMGDLPASVVPGSEADNSGEESNNLGDILQMECPDPRTFGGPELYDDIFDLLHNGRKSDSQFDLKNSPLAAYLYGLVGDKGMERSVAFIVHPMTKEASRDFLNSLPSKAVSTIAKICAKFAVSRHAELIELAAKYTVLPFVRPSIADHALKYDFILSLNKF
eukprot:CAMPEP_0194434368 /NCGR_PEP_ID=MMETSP0176-20130528/82837_1 /TAXON_ID=216777 /ORGANISM="Proboscia alata, Strain PI-D3" /LENGTH=541 /DNA_ID=CAMNT_0039252625 /DNA_START=84 /DNA_END=1707 /DNA_ORIENTATION=-